MAAGDAKVQLDLLSMPSDKRVLKPLDKDKAGILQSFWIDRRDADGQERPSFLCRPANTPTAQELNDRLPGDPPRIADSGGPKGGEVAREALSGGAAQLLAGQTGIDIGMPETHVVTLESVMIPGSDPTGLQKVTCSVQEARHAPGDLKKLSSIGKMALKPEQLAGLAIFDTLTLNTDGHAGNVLLDPGGNRVPIDHGESFAESNEQGIGRMKATLGSPHIALLGLPGAHDPMPKDMPKKLKVLDPEKCASGLKKDNAMIGAGHADMKDTVSAGAIDNARRAASFVKLAARHDPPLSPASIQVAMGNAADRLFGDAIDEKERAIVAQGRDGCDRRCPPGDVRSADRRDGPAGGHRSAPAPGHHRLARRTGQAARSGHAAAAGHRPRKGKPGGPHCNADGRQLDCRSAERGHRHQPGLTQWRERCA
jgi:hypothetical protein